MEINNIIRTGAAESPDISEITITRCPQQSIPMMRKLISSII